MLVAEAWVLGRPRRLAEYVRSDELHSAFQFDFLLAPFDAPTIEKVVTDAIAASHEVGAPSTWVLSNHDAQPYTDAAGWPERLTEQLIRPVRWAATMPKLASLGATTFVEVGPGTTLTGLAKRAHPDITLRNVATPGDLPLEIAHA